MSKLTFFLLLTFYSIPLAAQYEEVDGLLNAGDYPKALTALYEMDVENFSNEELAGHYKWIGETNRLSGDYEAALESLNKALGFLDFSTKTELAAKIQNELSIVTRSIHYYDDALKHSEKALEIALALQDSSLLYKSYLIKGNVYYKKDVIDSTVSCYKKSMSYLASDNLSGKALILNNTGNVYLSSNEFEKAERSFDEARNLFLKIGNKKKANLALLNRAAVQIDLNELDRAKVNLKNGLEAAEKNNWIHQVSLALNGQMLWMAKSNDLPNLVTLQDSIESVEHRILGEELAEAKEKHKAARLEDQLVISDLQAQKRRTAIKFLILSLVLLAFGFGMYFYNQRLKTKLAESQAAIKRQNALVAERKRIAAEMHDDLGGGLTSIKFLSQKVLRKLANDEPKAEVQKIVGQAQTLVGNMSEIIWAMNGGFDTLESFVGYTRRHVREYLEDFEMKLDFQVQQPLPEWPISGERRRNLFLIVKEIVHNAVKHSGGDQMSIQIETKGKKIHIQIKDNGEGIAKENALLGNGLRNIRDRVEVLGGTIQFENANGLSIDVKVPRK